MLESTMHIVFFFSISELDINCVCVNCKRFKWKIRVIIMTGGTVDEC